MFAKINLRLFVGMLFLFCLVSISVRGQSLLIYSDSWADTENGLADNPENNDLFIVGSGVVEITADAYHTVDMQVTMKSPQGRSSSAAGTWTQKSEGTSLTVTALISWTGNVGKPDTGIYQTELAVVPTCPDMHGTIGGGSSFPIGASYAKFILEFIGPSPNCNRRGCWYDRVTPCNVTCPGQPSLFHQSNPPGRLGTSILTMTPFGPLGCLRFFSISAGGPTDICYDIGWN